MHLLLLLLSSVLFLCRTFDWLVQFFIEPLSHGDNVKQMTQMKANQTATTTTTKTCEINNVNTAQQRIKIVVVDFFLCFSLHLC